MYDPAAKATSWALYLLNVLLICIIVAPRKDTLSLVYMFLFALNGVGFYSLYGIKFTMSESGFMSAALFWTLFTICVGLFPRKKKKAEECEPLIDKETEDEKEEAIKPKAIEYFVFAAVGVVAIILSAVYGDFRLFITFDDVYDYRMTFLEQNIPSIVLYILRFTSGVFLPYFFARFLMTRIYPLAAASAIFGLLMYGIDGLKTTLVMYAVILYIFITVSAVKRAGRHKSSIINIFITIMTAVMIICYLVYKRTDDLNFNTELYRIFVIPSSIADNYYNFIHDGEPLLLRESIMRYFFDSPYHTSINYLVTDKQDGAIANTGMYGDAYANFKMGGVVVYPVIYTAVLYLWQKLTNSEVSAYSIAIGFIMIWNTMNLSFFTWLLTGGVIVFMAITYLFVTKNRRIASVS